jgi:coenzyme F420-reducing hydrogenase beta subunit
MRIGIITFYWADNIGANLQCYALKRFLENMGHTVFVIQHRGETVSFKEEELKIVNFPHYKPKKIKYAAFATNNFNLTPIVVAGRFSLPLAKLKLDAIICGSDQIWSMPISGLGDTFFGGDFNGNDNVILASYAASLGATDLSDEGQKQLFQYKLRNFDFVSVREHTQSNLLAEIINAPVEVCIDPTLLLSEIDYKEIIAPRVCGDKYVYNHYYYNKNLPHLHKFTNDLLNKTKLPLVASNLTPTYKFKETVVDGSDTWAVEEALSGLKYAEFITTSSFHAVTFSIIFKKRFWYILKGDATDCRIIDLLADLGLQDRIVDGFQPIPDDYAKHPDWVSVYARLWELRKKSVDYLLLATGGKKKQRVADYLSSNDEFTCYGCAACADCCPVSAIKMADSAEGFPFPKIDSEKCVKCGLCHKVCPYNTKPQYDDYEPRAYLAYSLDDEIHTNSSSGGMFSTFANEILKRGGAVVGVRRDENFDAVYDAAMTAEDSFAFRYSKYEFPAHNDIFAKVKKVLEEGKLVLFTGSPCKIAGLKNYLKHDYDCLYTAEIVCHGAPSPIVQRIGLAAMEKKHNSKLISFTQRSTKMPSRAQASEYVFENGESELLPLRQDLLLLLLVQHISLRKCCNQCEFCKENRISDITFGDFWGSEKYYDGDVHKGVSCLIINTSKGLELLESVKETLFLKAQTVKDIYSGNHSSPSKMHKKRGELFARLRGADVDFEMLAKELLGRK